MHSSSPTESAFQVLADGIPEYAVFMADLEGRITGWGGGAQRHFGYPEADALGRPLAELLAGQREAAGAPLPMAEAAAHGRAEAEALWKRRDGSTFPGRVTFTALPSAEQAEAFGVIVRHTTEQHRLEDALRDAESRFAGIISISTDAIVSIDNSQRIIAFNQGAEYIFGYVADEVLGLPLEILIPHRFRATHPAQVRAFGESAVEARRMGERGQISGLRKNGELFPADASISKYFVGGHRVFTAVLRDATERHRAEEALARQAEELARSNAELEQFAYVASHDLQEPLRMVASYTQLLARRYRDKLDEDALEFIGFAVDGVTRMQSLINDLLAYSRVGTRPVTIASTDAGAVLDRVLVSLGPAIEEQQATVTHDPLPAVEADAGQLAQLMQNLIVNAIKFRRPDVPPRVHISAARGEGEWIFSLQDNGIGIEPEFRDRIFVIFQRLHSRVEYPGTGIGLSICKKIVERHGGKIWLDSTPGEGTTFYFSFPDRIRTD